MKKVFHILISFIFLALSIGITIHKHYSAGKLYAVSLFGQPESCCEIPCDCCDDESIVYQITDDYLFSSTTEIYPEYAASELIPQCLREETTHLNPIVYCSVEYKKDIHPPRNPAKYLPQIQSYLL